jgi:transcriptional regulator with XRE-family HTH domain
MGENNKKTEIGRNLQMLREKNNLTQLELAEKIGVDLLQVSQWENGVNLPDTENLLKLSKLFGVSVDHLLLQNKEKKDGSVYNEKIASLNFSNGDKITNEMNRFPFPVVPVIIYLILGFVFGLWHPGWLIFLSVPIYYVIAEGFSKKNGKIRDIYPVILAVIYVILGMLYNVWHPLWIIFITIPLYYWLVDLINRK